MDTPIRSLDPSALSDIARDTRTNGSDDEEAVEDEFAAVLGRAAAELADARDRLEMARSAAAGEEPKLDELDRQIEGLGSGAEARRRRARRLARSAAADLEETLQRLREWDL